MTKTRWKGGGRALRLWGWIFLFWAEGAMATIPVSDSEIERWARELAALSAGHLAAGEAEYPLMDDGNGWTFGAAEEARSGWYPALLWEVSALTGASDLSMAAKPYASRAFVGNVADGGMGALPMQAGRGEALLRWGEMDWQERPREAAEAFLAEMEARWMPEVGAFWHTAIPRPRTADGLAGGWVGRDTTSVASLLEMASLWEAATLAEAPAWRETIRSHVSVIVEHHIRPDGSSAEVVVYGGAVPLATAEDAFSGATTLARAHAMGLLGLVRLARLTGDRSHLDTFDRMYRYFVDRLRGPLPLWDMGAEGIAEEVLGGRFAVSSTEVDPWATDRGAAVLIALALAEAIPLATEGRGWVYYKEACRLAAAVETVWREAGPRTGRQALIPGLHGLWPGEKRGDIVIDTAHLRARRLLRSLGEEPRFEETFGLPADVTLRVTEARPWRMGLDAGALALHYHARLGAESGLVRLCLLESRVWDQFVLSLLLWPDRSASASGSDAVLVFGYKSAGDYHLVTLGSESGSIRLEHVEGTERTLLAEVEGGLPEAPAFNEVRMEGSPEGLVLEVGGDERLRWLLPPGSLSGMVGFGATGPFWFDDIAVSGISVPGEILPMDAWREAAFTERFDVAAWDDSDPDGDGRNNLLEYAMGSDPLDGSNHGKRLSLRSAGGALQITYPVEAQRNDVEVELQRSGDGGRTWEAVAGESIISSAVGWQTVATEVPSVGSGARWFRLFVRRLAVE